MTQIARSIQAVLRAAFLKNPSDISFGAAALEGDLYNISQLLLHVTSSSKIVAKYNLRSSS